MKEEHKKCAGRRQAPRLGLQGNRVDLSKAGPPGESRPPCHASSSTLTGAAKSHHWTTGPFPSCPRGSTFSTEPDETSTRCGAIARHGSRDVGPCLCPPSSALMRDSQTSPKSSSTAEGQSRGPRPDKVITDRIRWQRRRKDRNLCNCASWDAEHLPERSDG